VRDDALRSLDVVARIRPSLADQIVGIATGAGVELWRVAALNARTDTQVLDVLREAVAACLDPALLDPDARLPAGRRSASFKT
jgi:hypothetical protein